MKKGKFGIVLCFYPIAAFAAVILNSPVICLAMVAAAVFLERDEWAGRQTLQALMASALVFFVDKVAQLLSASYFIPVISTVLSVVSTVAFVVVYLAAAIFSILGIIRVSKDGEANMPVFSDLAYRVYGLLKPKPVQVPPVYPPYDPAQPYSAPVSPPPAPAQQLQPPFQGPFSSPNPAQGYAQPVPPQGPAQAPVQPQGAAPGQPSVPVQAPAPQAPSVQAPAVQASVPQEEQQGASPS